MTTPKLQSTHYRVSWFKLALVIVGLVILIAIFASRTGAFDLTKIESREQADIMDGITLAHSLTNADKRYMRTSMQWLRDFMPEWFAYITEAKPFTMMIDEQLNDRGIISDAKCCYARGMGLLTFGVHFERWPVHDAAQIWGMQPYQIQVLSTLIHEVTHIRDQREGRIEKNINSNTCIAAERSAYAKEVEFARALIKVRLYGDAVGRENYHLVAERQLELSVNNFEGVSWKIACLLMNGE